VQDGKGNAYRWEDAMKKTNEDFVKIGYGVMNEISLIGAACGAMAGQVSPVNDEDNVVGFFHGAASVLNRAAENVCELVIHLEELLKQSDKGEAAAGKPNETAGR
jgi:hypothetical protein